MIRMMTTSSMKWCSLIDNYKENLGILSFSSVFSYLLNKIIIYVTRFWSFFRFWLLMFNCSFKLTVKFKLDFFFFCLKTFNLDKNVVTLTESQAWKNKRVTQIRLFWHRPSASWRDCLMLLTNVSWNQKHVIAFERAWQGLVQKFQIVSRFVKDG